MKTIQHNNGYGTVYTFRIVDKIPEGYHVWNIPNNATPGYLPLAIVRKSYTVDTNTLLAVPVDPPDKAILMRATGLEGWSNLAKTRRALAHIKDPEKAKLARLVIEIYSSYM